MFNLKKKVMSASENLPSQLRVLNGEEVQKVSGGAKVREVRFGKGCIGSWEETKSGFKQKCKP
ncbi:MAG: hypothetical protein MK214_01465 [Thalassotalea sp.]|nr:hypothetical protein [Thalassotalea sp.]